MMNTVVGPQQVKLMTTSTNGQRGSKSDVSVNSRYTRHPKNCGSVDLKRRYEQTKTVLNALAHSAAVIQQFLTKKQVAVLNHSPYSPDLSPPDYFLFPKVKLQLKGAIFDTIEGIQKAVTDQLNKISAEDFSNTMKKLETRANLCITSNGSYFE